MVNSLSEYRQRQGYMQHEPDTGPGACGGAGEALCTGRQRPLQDQYKADILGMCLLVMSAGVFGAPSRWHTPSSVAGSGKSVGGLNS